MFFIILLKYYRNAKHILKSYLKYVLNSNTRKPYSCMFYKLLQFVLENNVQVLALNIYFFNALDYKFGAFI